MNTIAGDIPWGLSLLKNPQDPEISQHWKTARHSRKLSALPYFNQSSIIYDFIFIVLILFL